MGKHDSGLFSGAGDVNIFWQSWTPEGDVRATVVLVHGAGEHSGRYSHLIPRLIAAGYAVRALDHRGHGQSSGPRALIDQMDRAIADLGHVVIEAGERPFLLGHSMGGCISLAYALDHQEQLAGLILSAPLATLPPTPSPLRAVVRAMGRIAPKVGMIGVDPADISRDPAEVRAYVEDPLNHHGKLPARTLVELADTIATFPARLRTLTLPLLTMHGSADPLVNVAASRTVAEHAGSADKTLNIYKGCYHEIFNELVQDREQVFDDLIAWLDAH